MKKILATLTLVLSVAAASPAFAASWTHAVNAAIAHGHYDAISQIVAKNPKAGGAIATYLLQQAQNNISNPAKAVHLMDLATQLGAQISPDEADSSIDSIKVLLKLANDPAFERKHPREAAQIFADALSLLSQKNLANADPELQSVVLAEASDFISANPDLDTTKLKEEVSLALGGFGASNPDLSTIRLRPRNDLPPQVAVVETPVTPPVVPPVNPPVTPPGDNDDDHHHGHHHHDRPHDPDFRPPSAE